MKNFHINKSSISGTLEIPGSKSQTLRAILFASLAQGKSSIHRYLPSSDTQAMIEACKIFGAKIDITPQTLFIEGVAGKLSTFEDVINAGNSGIVLRFCTAIACLSGSPCVITGDHSIRHQRRMAPLMAALKQLGGDVQSIRGDGFAPLIIRGPIGGGTATIEGQDSQFVSALLIAAAFASAPIIIKVSNPGELPWIDMTLHWLKRLGIPYENLDYTDYALKGGADYQGFDYTVPGDFSTAAFPIAAALINGTPLTLTNLDMDDPQGDKELIDVFKQMGADIDYYPDTRTLQVRPGNRLTGLTVDINRFIDAVTILAVVACHAEGTTHLTNAAIARNKESNRLAAITSELSKMGASIHETAEGLIIRKSQLKGTSVNSHKDHRMAMSLAVAAMGAEGATHIHDVECVSKTYPLFEQEFAKLGAAIEVRP